MPTAMIWGANGGIGRAITAELMKQDWTVISVSRQPDEMEAHASISLEADVTSDFAVQNAVMSASYEVDAVDLWIYAAGDITASRAGEMQDDQWQQIVGANLTGAFTTTHHSLPLLAEDAHLFYLGAVSERLRLPGLSAYAAAKAGLEAFADTLRKEERKKKITVVRPGAVATPFWEKVPLRLPKDAATPEKVAKRIFEAYESGHTGQLDLV